MRILFLKLYSKCVENPCNVLNAGDEVSQLEAFPCPVLISIFQETPSFFSPSFLNLKSRFD